MGIAERVLGGPPHLGAMGLGQKGQKVMMSTGTARGGGANDQ